jgi:hypothetical protein
MIYFINLFFRRLLLNLKKNKNKNKTTKKLGKKLPGAISVNTRHRTKTNKREKKTQYRKL